jgi:hypothetical protein
MTVADPRNNTVKYEFRRTPVRRRASTAMYSPPMGSSEGTTGYCGWRTGYQVENQIARTQLINAPELSLDFPASIWAWWAYQNNPEINWNQIYGLTALTRGIFSILTFYGTLSRKRYGDGVRMPTDEEFALALTYKAPVAYTVPHFQKGDPDSLALFKELIDSGLTCAVSTMLNSFPFNSQNGGVVPPQPPNAPATQGHLFTGDTYDDDGFNGAGLVGGTTNGMGPWSMTYADYINYCSVHGTMSFVLPLPTYSFPPPVITPPTNAELLASLATLVNSLRPDMPITQTLIDQLKGIVNAMQPDPVVVTPPPVLRTEYIVNALPAGQQGPSAPGSVEFTGPWNNSATAGRYLNDGLYSGLTPTPDGTPLATYTFKSPPLPKDCSVSVYLWWAAYANRSVRVPVTACGVTKELNQQINGSQWFLHGTYLCLKDAVVAVTISNANGQAAADAVRFVSA